MSLLQRVERAQQAAEAAESNALVPVAPAPPPPPAAAARTPAREELLLDIRVRLQDEVIGAFDTLLDVSATDIRTKVEGIVDRVIAQNGFAVTRTERIRLVDEMVDELTGFGPL